MSGRGATLKRLTETIVRVADLAEAEGRAMRQALREEARAFRAAIARLGIGFAFLLAATPLLIVGLCLLLAAVYMSLADPIGPAAASALTGLVTLLVAGGLLWTFKKTAG